MLYDVRWLLSQCFGPPLSLSEGLLGRQSGLLQNNTVAKYCNPLYPPTQSTQVTSAFEHSRMTSSFAFWYQAKKLLSLFWRTIGRSCYILVLFRTVQFFNWLNKMTVNRTFPLNCIFFLGKRNWIKVWLKLNHKDSITTLIGNRAVADENSSQNVTKSAFFEVLKPITPPHRIFNQTKKEFRKSF